MVKKKLKKLKNIFLGIALVMGLVPEMGFTVYADDTKAYAAYDVTTEANKTKSGDALTALQVSFKGIPWYIIADDSTAADAGTVTLLAADTSFGTCAFDDTTASSSSYIYSTVKKRLDELTETGSFKSMAKFIADTDLTDVNVTEAKLFLLSYDEAGALPEEVKKIDFTGGNCTKGEWWTRSTDTSPRRVLYLEGVRDGSGGGIDNNSPNIANAYGVRPALRLDLSKVSFSAETREFSPDTAKFPCFYIVNTTTTVRFNNCDWYVIDDDSVDAGTVTLLAAGTEFGRSVFPSDGQGNSYNNSYVKEYLGRIVSGTAGEGKPDFNGVAAAIQEVTLITYKFESTEVSETTNDAQMFLLSTEEAEALPEEILKSGFTDGWWLRSPGIGEDMAAYVDGNVGYVYPVGNNVSGNLGVRPALKLNLSSVIFSSGSNTFSLKTSHTHSFSYSVSGATITATCTADGCDLPAVDNKHVATLTIAASGGTYDGTTPYGATITDDSSIRGGAKVWYRKKTDGSYGTATETAPTDAGDYKASITVGGATASVEYTIGKADPTANAPTGLTATYGQTLADVSLEGKNPEGNTPGTWAWLDSTKSVGNVVIPAATFKANFTPTSSNYNTVENVDVSVTVSKANAVPATVTANNRAYDGTDNPLVTITGTATGGEMQYAPGTATEATQPYTTSIPTATDAGTYYVWYKVEGDGNHKGTDPRKLEIEIVLIPSLAGGRVTAPAGAKLIFARYVTLENSKDGIPVMTSVKETLIAEDCAKTDPAVLLGLSKTPARGCKLLLLDPETGSPLCEAWDPGS